MRKNIIIHFILCTAILSFVLTGCGGGGATSQSVTGVAASGAPIVGDVFLQDSSSPAQVRTTTTADNGAFTVDVSGLVEPYLLRVEWTDNAGHNKMYAFAEHAGTTNINPFSNVAFAAAVGVPDQVALAANFDPARYRSIASRHEAVCDNLRTALGPLFELFQTAKDPVTDTFNADHTGLDALFDNVKIFVNNGMIVVTNKNPYRLIFEGPIDNITAGTFYRDNMPTVAGAGGGTIDGAALYTNNCSSCHGALASSSKRGRSAAQISAAIGSVSAMKSISLTSTQINAIATALGTTSTPPTSTNGAALYGTYCAGCHGALASSSKLGRTATQISAAIARVSNMSSLSTLSSTQIDAIAAALVTTSTTPPLVCGSCHAIPPATGHHNLHVNSEGVSCGTCHGTGYSKTTVNPATHDNGVVNIASTPGWNPTTRTCSNACHGTHTW